MKKYIIRDREAGNKIASFDSYEEAVRELQSYEAEDKRNEEYTPDFYEIVEDEQRLKNPLTKHTKLGIMNRRYTMENNKDISYIVFEGEMARADMSVRQIKNIVYKCEQRLFK